MQSWTSIARIVPGRSAGERRGVPVIVDAKRTAYVRERAGGTRELMRGSGPAELRGGAHAELSTRAQSERRRAARQARDARAAPDGRAIATRAREQHREREHQHRPDRPVIHSVPAHAGGQVVETGRAVRADCERQEFSTQTNSTWIEGAPARGSLGDMRDLPLGLRSGGPPAEPPAPPWASPGQRSPAGRRPSSDRTLPAEPSTTAANIFSDKHMRPFPAVDARGRRLLLSRARSTPSTRSPEKLPTWTSAEPS